MRRPSPLPSGPASPSEPPRVARVPVPTNDPDQTETVSFARPWHAKDEPSRGDRSVASPGARPVRGDAGGARSATPEPTPPAGPSPAPQDGVERREAWTAARARRRAQRGGVRRFTARQRRRRRMWFGVAGALVLLVFGTLSVAYSPLFSVDRVSVVGTSALDPDAVESALSDQLGTPLPLVDAGAVKAKLVAFPLIESYTLEARPPHELIVRIIERTPVGTVESEAGYTLVDAAGVALSTTNGPPAGYPLLHIAGGVGSRTFEAAGTVFRALPDDIRAQVTAIAATTPNDVALTLGATGTTVVWGDAHDSAMKALVLARTMESHPPADVTSYDVSSYTVVVVR